MRTALLVLALVSPGGTTPIPPGADAFTVSTARLRAGSAADSRVIARIPAGTRVVVHGERGAAVEGTPETERAVRGFLARGALAVFTPGEEGTREMAAAGRFLVQDPDRRALGLALLSRADERMRCGGERDTPLVLLLAETRESLGLPASDAFHEAFELEEAGTKRDAALRERAEAGILRARFPSTSRDFVALWTETAAWLDLAERAETPGVLAGSAGRLEPSALALGRLLLAAGRLDELSALESRVETCATRLAALDPQRAPGLDGASRLLAAMRGNGTPPFPQSATWGAGPSPLTVTIGGELGSLTLVVGRGEPRPIPVLPVPGSLRIAPDGRSAAWLEVSAPGTIVPMLVRIDRDGVRGDATLLSGGRLTRDRTRKARLLAKVLGFSEDGGNLLVSVAAWDEEPAARGRLALVSTRSGDLSWEAPGRDRGLAEARHRLRRRAR